MFSCLNSSLSSFPIHPLMQNKGIHRYTAIQTSILVTRVAVDTRQPKYTYFCMHCPVCLARLASCLGGSKVLLCTATTALLLPLLQPIKPFFSAGDTSKVNRRKWKQTAVSAGNPQNHEPSLKNITDIHGSLDRLVSWPSDSSLIIHYFDFPRSILIFFLA